MTYTNQYDASHWPPAPVIEIVVGHPTEETPPSIVLKGIVDSGADCTVIPSEAVEKLGLPFMGQKDVKDFSGRPHKIARYAARITIPTLKGRLITVISIKGTIEETKVLAGRYILNHHKVTLDGLPKRLEIE